MSLIDSLFCLDQLIDWSVQNCAKREGEQWLSSFTCPIAHIKLCLVVPGREESLGSDALLPCGVSPPSSHPLGLISSHLLCCCCRHWLMVGRVFVSPISRFPSSKGTTYFGLLCVCSSFTPSAHSLPRLPPSTH